MPYQPGTHVIASFSSNDASKLTSHRHFQQAIDLLIAEHGLNKLGEVYHDFAPGFTGVVCLSESHVSVHTWPEHGLVNIDIYLSNYHKNNDGTVTAIYQKLKDFFKAEVSNEQIIRR